MNSLPITREKIGLTILDDFEKTNASSGIADYPASPGPWKCISCQSGKVCP